MKPYSIPSPLMKLSQSSNSRPKWLYKSRVVTPRRPAERHRETVVFVRSHGGEWCGTDPLWPSDHLKSQRGQSRQETHLAGSLKGSIILQNTVVILEDVIIIILTLERKAYGGCNLLIWVGWEKCVGHKCLWTGDERLSWYEMFLCWYQTPLHLQLNRRLIHQVLPSVPSKVCPMSLMSLYSCSRSMCWSSSCTTNPL